MTFTLLKLLFTILYLSVFTIALPHSRNQNQSPLSSSSTTSSKIICKEDQLKCGNVCYYPTEADCDPQFLSLTRFSPQITRFKKEALEAQKKSQKTGLPRNTASNPVAKAASPTSTRSKKGSARNF
ncbi:hypothetical protein TWF281_003557 [Arthrobotrys megalospora]